MFQTSPWDISISRVIHLKILKGKDSLALYDESRRKILLRNKEVSVTPNMIISTGDTVTLGGDSYDVLDYNPSWFAEVAKRGPQVIHTKDSSYIIGRAGIRPGQRILEAGVGSGALSSALLWILGDKGKLYSVESEETSIRTASENVNIFSDTGNWEIIRGDVKTAPLPEDLDTIILDIPDPWDAIENVLWSLKAGGYVVTYSPTFNQVDLSVGKMVTSGLSVIETVEIIKRNILVRPDATRPDHRMIGHTAFITFAVKRSGHNVKIS